VDLLCKSILFYKGGLTLSFLCVYSILKPSLKNKMTSLYLIFPAGCDEDYNVFYTDVIEADSLQEAKNIGYDQFEVDYFEDDEGLKNLTEEEEENSRICGIFQVMKIWRKLEIDQKDV